MFQFVANAQIVNKFRDSTWFKSGVQFDGNVVFKSGAGSGKVWTSNSNGTGSWQTISTGGDSIYYFRTIAQLRTAMSAHTLKEGAKYQATDFQTIYDQPYYTALPDPEPMATPKTASTEHLVFTANSDSTFDNYVSSVEYPEDIIKFDFSFTETEVTNTPAKGRISYREDIKGNICEYDFRNILFKRYRNNGVYSSIFDNDSISGEFPTFVDYDNSLGNVMTGYVTAYLTYSLITLDFLLPNNVIFGTAIKNKFDVAYNCTFLGDCNENFFGDGCQVITCYAGCYYNYFGHGCALWTFLGNCENNYFGDGGFNCTFGARCNDNNIRDKIEEFTAGTDFKRNIQYGLWSNSAVGDNFTDGVIYGLADSIYAGDDNFKIEIKSGSGIVIGDDNSNISFGGSKHLNSLNNISGISNVTFSGLIDGSLWSNGITIPLHPELYSTYAKQIIKASNGSVYTRYFNGATDVLTIID